MSMATNTIKSLAPTQSDSNSGEAGQRQRGQTNLTSSLLDKCEEPAGMLIQEQLSGPLVWSGADFKHENPNTLFLDVENVCELEEALEAFKSLELDGDQINKSNFPLPKLSKVLETMATFVHTGQGFFIVHGLNLDKYTVEDSTIIFLGIASYVGDKRGLQDKKGNVLAHVTSSKAWDVPMSQRHAIHSTTALPFHNDMGCDILALQVRHMAESGGYTYLSSASAVFNKLRKYEPDVVKVLFEHNWPIQYSIRQSRHYLAPVMTMQANRLMTSVDPQRVGPHPAARASSIPHLTKDQEYALKRLTEVARSTELRLNLKRGDLLFINNWALLHRREAYDDEGVMPRHLVRLWLRNTKLAWPVPSSMQLPWQAAYGKEVQNILPRYALHPMPKYHVPKYTAGSASFLIEDSDDDSGN